MYKWILSFFLGTISLCLFKTLPDPRVEGSKNPGATNVLRIGGKIPALFTLLADVLKGFIPVILARMFCIDGFLLGLVGVFAVFGHMHPIFFKFKGGKGVATFFGVILALSLPLTIVVVIIWALIALLFRYSSVAALVAVISACMYSFLFRYYGYFLPIVIMALMIILKHGENIKKLHDGKESKIKF